MIVKYARDSTSYMERLIYIKLSSPSSVGTSYYKVLITQTWEAKLDDVIVIY